MGCAMPSLTPDALTALEEKLRLAFNEFDADGSGAVDTKEITKMMLSLGLLVQPEVIAKMIKEADTDDSGQIEWDEFKAVMVKQAESGSSTGPSGTLRSLGQALRLMHSRRSKRAMAGACKRSILPSTAAEQTRATS